MQREDMPFFYFLTFMGIEENQGCVECFTASSLRLIIVYTAIVPKWNLTLHESKESKDNVLPHER